MLDRILSAVLFPSRTEIQIAVVLRTSFGYPRHPQEFASGSCKNPQVQRTMAQSSSDHHKVSVIKIIRRGEQHSEIESSQSSIFFFFPNESRCLKLDLPLFDFQISFSWKDSCKQKFPLAFSLLSTRAKTEFIQRFFFFFL